ncbi:SMI1/KNR4 family protein [Paenibacillus melissococcoides]|uniref:SMI1/KNR4 family protein n=1 Tax=Paenibacillus TaxID=44249 RepID=UPI0020C1349D|nr:MULTISPECIES: SMI1/KNR4 family protein [Paenibacillus]MEB9894538.1 SMI1/KNR4 family protein [Bacillus cereus]CAH8715352.1 SMI1/KNR4 family protein [Paenibacillus melissococcoides]CAH8716302.1 SMI1/KNR4 family protein [Paenibacillus melissococcoides]
MNEITELLREELPELAASLHPPATEMELRQAEEELGFPLPAELRELYRIHNGESEAGPGLFFGLPFLSLDSMLTEWRIWAELEEEYAWEGEHFSVPAAWIKERYINRYWLPISKDWGGNHLGIDLDPDEQGRKGQVINYGRDSRVHFLDAIRSLDLPVLEPVRADADALDPREWFGGLDEEWKARVVAAGGSPEAFVRAKQLLLCKSLEWWKHPMKRMLEERSSGKT